MDELKKLFRRSKSRTRKPSTSSPRADREDESQNLSPGRPAPQRQRSNTLPSIPPVSTRYNELSDGRAPETETTSLHSRKASLPDPARSTARKPVAGLTDSQSRARSETRQSSAPVSNSSPYDTAGSAGAGVASAEAYGSPSGAYNNLNNASTSSRYSQDAARQQPPLPSNARDSINNAQQQQQYASHGSSGPMAAVGAVGGASGAQHSRNFSTASKASDLPIASEFSSDSWYRKEAPNASPVAESHPQGTPSARSSISTIRDTPTRGRVNPNIPPVPSIPAGLAGRTSMDTQSVQSTPLNGSTGMSGHRKVDSENLGKNTVPPLEPYRPRTPTSPRTPERMRNTSSSFARPTTPGSSSVDRPTTPGSRISPPGSPGSEKFWESYPTLARQRSFHGSVVHGPYRHASGVVDANAMEEYKNLPRKSHDESRKVTASGYETNRATTRQSVGAGPISTSPSNTTQGTRYSSGTTQSTGPRSPQRDTSSQLSDNFNKSMSLDREPSTIKAGQHTHRSHLLVQESNQPVSLKGIVDLSTTEDTTTDVRYASPVYHENITETIHHIREERLTREIHNYHVFHRILPVIEVEVLPAKHLLLLNDRGETMEIPEPEHWSGQANLESRLKQHSRNWIIAETASKFTDSSILPGPRHFTAMNFNGINDRKFVNSSGIPTTEQWWVYPPMIDDGARRRGITQPIYFDETGTERAPVGVNEYGGHTLPTN